jgi:hypothetical protein
MRGQQQKEQVMAAGHSKEIVCCKNCGRDVRGGPCCGKCTGRGGRARFGEGFRDRQGSRDICVISSSEIFDGEDDDEG